MSGISSISKFIKNIIYIEDIKVCQGYHDIKSIKRYQGCYGYQGIWAISARISKVMRNILDIENIEYQGYKGSSTINDIKGFYFKEIEGVL